MGDPRELRGAGRASSFDELPEVLTVEEAAAVLRIGRGAAYDLARQWRQSAGREGLPVVALGRSLRVPKAALRRLLDLGDAAATPAPATRGESPSRPNREPVRRRTAAGRARQSMLFGDATADVPR